MFKFNPKMSIQKYPIFRNWYNFFSANVSNFTDLFLLKIKTLSSDICTKNKVTPALFSNKTYLF